MTDQTKSQNDPDEAVHAMIADPEKLRRDIEAAVRRDNPSITQCELGAAWEQLADQMGF